MHKDASHALGLFSRVLAAPKALNRRIDALHRAELLTHAVVLSSHPVQPGTERYLRSRPLFPFCNLLPGGPMLHLQELKRQDLYFGSIVAAEKRSVELFNITAVFPSSCHSYIISLHCRL